MFLFLFLMKMPSKSIYYKKKRKKMKKKKQIQTKTRKYCVFCSNYREICWKVYWMCICLFLSCSMFCCWFLLQYFVVSSSVLHWKILIFYFHTFKCLQQIKQENHLKIKKQQQPQQKTRKTEISNVWQTKW